MVYTCSGWIGKSCDLKSFLFTIYPVIALAWTRWWKYAYGSGFSWFIVSFSYWRQGVGVYHQDTFECWAASWQSSYGCIFDGFWNRFSYVHIWIWYWSKWNSYEVSLLCFQWMNLLLYERHPWNIVDGLGDFIYLFSSCLLFIVVCGSCMLWMDWNSHSCIGKSCDGWDMVFAICPVIALAWRRWWKNSYGSDFSWFIVRFRYLRQCVNVVPPGCYLCDWNKLGEHWTPRTCVRYPYYVSSDCKCCVTKAMLRGMYCDGWEFLVCTCNYLYTLATELK